MEFEEADFDTWTKGWTEKVYTEDCVNPDITLGELLLLYFEWMSVHKVCLAVPRVPCVPPSVHGMA
jgi:hypothetical protein